MDNKEDNPPFSIGCFSPFHKKSKKIDGNNKLSEKDKKMMSELTSNSDVIFVLIFNKDESLFYSDKKVEMENDGERKVNFTKILTDEKSVYYLNMKTNEKFKQSSTFSKLLISLDPTVNLASAL